jgi:hypothetical protein
MRPNAQRNPGRMPLLGLMRTRTYSAAQVADRRTEGACSLATFRKRNRACAPRNYDSFASHSSVGVNFSLSSSIPSSGRSFSCQTALRIPYAQAKPTPSIQVKCHIARPQCGKSLAQASRAIQPLRKCLRINVFPFDETFFIKASAKRGSKLRLCVFVSAAESGERRLCRVVWRRSGEVGVAFTDRKKVTFGKRS